MFFLVTKLHTISILRTFSLKRQKKQAICGESVPTARRATAEKARARARFLAVPRARFRRRLLDFSVFLTNFETEIPEIWEENSR